ncbi:MAG TPA: hypothetical protein VN799_05325 [Acidimicrobiales bacterium]|nr:hypothetical protein [Acidimicrobiales bacterium]
MPADRPTRVAADLLDSAASEGRRERRSAKAQLDYWTRLGRAVSMHQSAARRRVEAVLAGEAEMAELSEEERLVANAELDLAIARRAGATPMGEYLAAEGITTVALDAEGNLVEHRPDGTEEVVTVSSTVG